MDYFVIFFQHLCLVGGSIALLFLPFLLVFYLRNRAQIVEKRPHFNQFMENFFASNESYCLVFTWALLEATIWFVIPEFLLFLIIFMKVTHKRKLLFYDIAGTVLGTVVGISLALSSDIMLKIPYVYQSMIDQTHKWYEELGVLALIHQPFSGVPYKVFLSEAHLFSLPILFFIFFAITVRIARYIFGYSIMMAIYPLINRFVYRNYLILLTLAIIIFTALLLRVSNIYS